MALSFQGRAGPLAEIRERSRASDALGGADEWRTGSSCSDIDHRARAPYQRPRSATKRKVLCRKVRALAVHGGAGQADAEACIAKPQAKVERTPFLGR